MTTILLGSGVDQRGMSGILALGYGTVPRTTQRNGRLELPLYDGRNQVRTRPRIHDTDRSYLDVCGNLG